MPERASPLHPMRSNLLIYGVTGYTGRLISRLAAAAGLAHLAAGRDLERVAAQADPWLVPWRSFSLSDPAKIDRGLAGVAVVLNAAGPFTETAGPLAEGCVRAGAHYLDLAGGVPELEAMRRLGPSGRQAGVMLMPGVGFAILPSDALAARLKRRLPAAVHLRLACEAAGGRSRGALAALLSDLHRQGLRRCAGELVPAWAAEQVLRVDLGGGPRVAVTDPWRGDLATAYWSSVYAAIDTFAVYPAELRWLLRSMRVPAIRRLVAGRAAQGLLRQLPRHLPAGPKESKLATGLTRIWAQAEDAGGRRVTARLRGPQANLFTAHTALWIAQRALAGRVRVGFQTPVTAYGPDLIDRLVEDIEDLDVTWSTD